MMTHRDLLIHRPAECPSALFLIPVLAIAILVLRSALNSQQRNWQRPQPNCPWMCNAFTSFLEYLSPKQMRRNLDNGCPWRLHTHRCGMCFGCMHRSSCRPQILPLAFARLRAVLRSRVGCSGPQLAFDLAAFLFCAPAVPDLASPLARRLRPGAGFGQLLHEA